MPSDAVEKSRNSSGKSQPDHAIARLAERQHGVVATRQLLALGLTQDDIDYRARIGRLHRIHRGVYAVGHPTLTPKGTRVHRTTLHPEDITIRDGIPITSVARTILDLAAHLNDDQLTRLIEDADRKELFDLKALDRAIARRPRAAGVRRLKAVLAAYRGPADTRSKLERDFRALIVKAGLPEPQYNVAVAGLTVDVYWPEWKLVVELDGEPYHRPPSAFETDRVRDATLQKIDIRVLRVTGRRMDNEPGAVLEDILALRRVS